MRNWVNGVTHLLRERTREEIDSGEDDELSFEHIGFEKSMGLSNKGVY